MLSYQQLKVCGTERIILKFSTNIHENDNFFSFYNNFKAVYLFIDI